MFELPVEKIDPTTVIKFSKGKLLFNIDAITPNCSYIAKVSPLIGGL